MDLSSLHHKKKTLESENKWKKINVALLFVGAAFSLVLWSYVGYFCDTVECYQFHEKMSLDTLLLVAIGLSTTLFLLVCFPVFVFKKWLMYIFTWFGPAAFIGIFSVPLYGGSVIGVGREYATILWMSALFVITFIFAFTQLYILKSKTK